MGKINKSNKKKRAITHRSGKKRGQKMIASENRKKEKLEWEEYNKNWNKVHNPDNMPSKSANNNNASGSESDDSDHSDIDLQDVVNMVDDEYKVSNLAFIEREKLNSEVRKKIKKEEEDSKKKYNSLAFRDVNGKLIKRELDLEKKKREVESLNEEESMDDSGDEENVDVDVKKEAFSDEESDGEDKPKSVLELLQLRQRKLEALKLKLSRFSSNCIASPNNTSHLKSLRNLTASILDEKAFNNEPEIAILSSKLKILTVCEIYISILPSYIISDRSEMDEVQKLSKDVKARWENDKQLLNGYQDFLTLLETVLLEDSRTSRKFTHLKQCCIRALGQLLVKCTDTNYHKNICNLTISCLANKDNRNKFTITEITKGCIELFSNDNTGYVASANLTVSICEFMRGHNFNLPVDIFETFTLLEIKEINKNKKQQIYEEKQQIKLRTKQAGYKISKADKQRLKQLKYRGGH